MKFLKVWAIVFLGVLPAADALAVGFFDNLNIGFLGEKEKEVNKVLWQDGPNRYIKLAPQDTALYGPNAHPVELDQKEINVSLGLLRIAADTGVVPVFTEEQAALLSIMLASGLKVAAADQDIVFALEKSESSLMGLKKDAYFLAGRAFYQGGLLHIILGDYDRVRNISFEAAYDPSKAGIVSYSFEHGKRAKQGVGASAFTQKLYPTDGISNRVINSGPRSDWFMIDLKETSRAFVSREHEARQSEMDRKRKELQEILGPGYSMPAPVPVRSTEERLISLNELKSKGLITDEEYQAKRKQILDDL